MNLKLVFEASFGNSVIFGKNCKNNFWLLWWIATFAFKILPNFRYFLGLPPFQPLNPCGYSQVQKCAWISWAIVDILFGNNICTFLKRLLSFLVQRGEKKSLPFLSPKMIMFFKKLIRHFEANWKLDKESNINISLVIKKCFQTWNFFNKTTLQKIWRLLNIEINTGSWLFLYGCKLIKTPLGAPAIKKVVLEALGRFLNRHPFYKAIIGTEAFSAAIRRFKSVPEFLCQWVVLKTFYVKLWFHISIWKLCFSHILSLTACSLGREYLGAVRAVFQAVFIIKWFKLFNQKFNVFLV